MSSRRKSKSSKSSKSSRRKSRGEEREGEEERQNRTSQSGSNSGPTRKVRMEDLSYYEILGVPPNADENAIKKAYRKNAIRWHPGTYPQESSPKAIRS